MSVSNSEELIKQCIKCLKNKEISNFYKVNEFYYQSKCKICHNLDRKNYKNDSKKYYSYMKKPTGVDKLGDETKYNITSDILYSDLTYKQICVKNNVKYQTLISWVKKGQLPKRKTIKERKRSDTSQY